MKNKYYTPDISEFYVGFEYEECGWLYNPSRPDNIFKQKIFNVEDYIEVDGEYFLSSYLKEKAIRVKYLDKEDIESLGWKETVHNKVKCFELGFYKLFWFNQPFISIECILNCTSNTTQIFRGTIKNKSELKKLLKQLGINA